jgi:hypothetical protein
MEHFPAVDPFLCLKSSLYCGEKREGEATYLGDRRGALLYLAEKIGRP